MGQGLCRLVGMNLLMAFTPKILSHQSVATFPALVIIGIDYLKTTAIEWLSAFDIAELAIKFTVIRCSMIFIERLFYNIHRLRSLLFVFRNRRLFFLPISNC